MRSSKIITIAFILLTILMLTNQLTSVQSSTSADYSGLRTNRLILNEPDLTFKYNDTFTVYLLMENIGQQIIYNLNFNYSIDQTLFSIVSSSNKTSTSHEFVYNNIDKIEPGQKDTFNLTLRVVSNTTQDGVLIDAMTLNYQFSEFHLQGLALTPQLTINIQGTSTSRTYASGDLGTNNIDATILAIIFALPILLAFILSFIFGRRRHS